MKEEVFCSGLSAEEQAEIQMFDAPNYEAFLSCFQAEVPAEGVMAQG